MSPRSTVTPLRTRLTSGSWWFRSSDGRLIIWQPPNAALSVWLLTLGIGLIDLSSARATMVAGVGHGALLVWALDEVLRGESPFRRTLGAAVFIGQIASLALS